MNRSIRCQRDRARHGRIIILCAMLAMALWVVLAGLAAQPADANVTLQSFDAIALDGDSTVFVEWVTATEENAAGFFLARSLTNTASSFVRISPYIQHEGDGSSYEFTDDTTQLNTTYYYRLEVINTDQSVEYHGPITATAGVAVTATPTDTPADTPSTTLTLTPTFTPTLTPTFTLTVTLTPTPTATPVPTTPPVISVTPSSLPDRTTTPQPTLSGTSQRPTQAAFGARTATPAAQGPILQTSTANAPARAKAAPTGVILPNADALVSPLGQTNPTVVAMAPVVISTEAPDSTAPAASSTHWAFLFIIAAVLLLIGGLYAILRQAGK